MKKIFCLSFLSALVFFSAQAQVDLGKKIDLLKGQNGKPSFGLQYSIEEDAFFSTSFSVLGNQLIGTKPDSINPIFWAVINITTGEFLVPWTQDTRFPSSATILPGSTQAFGYSIRDVPTALKALRSLKSSAFVFSLKNQSPKASVYIDLRELCQKFPEKFMNLDSYENGCP